MQGWGRKGEPRGCRGDVGKRSALRTADLEINDNSGRGPLEGHREGFIDGDRNGSGGGELVVHQLVDHRAVAVAVRAPGLLVLNHAGTDPAADDHDSLAIAARALTYSTAGKHFF